MSSDTTDTVAVDYRDFTRLLALEKAAREYRKQVDLYDYRGSDDLWRTVEFRERLFALLDQEANPQ